MRENAALYEAIEKLLKGEPVRVTADSMRLEEWFDLTNEQVLDLHEKQAAKDAAIRSIVQDSFATLGQPLTSLS